MSKTLYASDLDGTLLTSGAALCPHVRDALNKLIAGGLLFTFATARSYQSAGKITHGLDLRIPVVTYNGTFTVNPKTRLPIEARMLDAEAARDLVTYLKGERVPTLVYAYVDGTERVSWLLGNESRQIKDYLSERKDDPRMRGVETVDALFEGDIIYLTILSCTSKMHRAISIMADNPDLRHIMYRDIYGDHDWWLEVQHADASKAAALTALKKSVGADRLITFGDNINDIPMFKISDACYAVANAHEDVKRAATGIIASNDDHGVLRWLEENVHL